MATQIGAYDTNAESNQEALKKVTATTFGTNDRLDVFPIDNMLEIARDNISGMTFVHKFGEGRNIDSGIGFVDLWDGATISTSLRTYTFSTTADIDRISSSDNNDTQDIEIQGLDSSFDLVIQTITLTGQTPVALDTSLIRVFRLINRGSTDNAGDIYCFVNVATTAGVPDTITNTRAIIQAGNNQTLMAIYTVPNAKTAYMQNWYAANSNKKNQISDVQWLARPTGEVFQLKHVSAIETTGTSHIQHTYPVPEKIDGKTDIIMRADSSKDNGAVAAGFDLILVDD